jgi:predicted AlkP superfamily pyrophosphatase or phosphodiesterase
VCFYPWLNQSVIIEGKTMKKLTSILFILVVLDVAAQSPAGARKAVAAGAKKPTLVIAIVADQFRYDYLLRFGGDYTEGLHQLLTKGAVFTNAQYEHFPTFTSVGHAALLTGAYPSVNGIIGNQWFDRGSGKTVQSSADDSAQQVGGSGGRGSSPRNLLVSTVGDEMRMAGQGRNRVIGMSLKDYSGILMSGRMANAVYWFDGRAGSFATSTYYLPDLPQWVKDFNGKRLADSYKGKEWKGMKLPDETGPKLYGMLPVTGFGSALLEEMAEAAIKGEQLGKDADTDLLVLSFSANDYVGHSYGPDSEQAREISIDTDRMLGKLFRFVESHVGMANVMVVFAADHGVSPMPEVNEVRKMPGGRVPLSALRDPVQKALQEKFGAGNWILSVLEEAIYLNWDLIRFKKLSEKEVAAEAARAAMEVPHVFRVYTRDQLLNGFAPADKVGRRVLHGFSWARGGDLCVLLDPYYFVGGGRTTTHGSAFDYDTHVPVIFMGPGIKAGRFNESIAVNDVAPTLATILGVEIPSGSEGRVLSEILQ